MALTQLERLKKEKDSFIKATEAANKAKAEAEVKLIKVIKTNSELQKAKDVGSNLPKQLNTVFGGQDVLLKSSLKSKGRDMVLWIPSSTGRSTQNERMSTSATLLSS